MAIDIKKMRQKLADLHNKGGNGNTRFWKPQDGENVIRILPTADGDPFKHFHFHYNIGDAKGGILCPKKNFGNDCPVCDFVSKLYNNGDEESRNMARKMVAKSRFSHPSCLVAKKLKV